jgi:hypothetical protein
MWNLRKFEEVYSRYQSSGLGVKDFCRNECIHVSRFFYWQKKFKYHHRDKELTSDFVPLPFHPPGTVVKDSISFHSGTHRARVEESFELVYPNGVKLRLPLDTDIQKLEQLILLCR